MRKTGVYRDNLFLEHQPAISHPESPERLRVVYEALDKGDIAKHFIFPAFDPVRISLLRVAMTSFTFMLVDVPDPV